MSLVIGVLVEQKPELISWVKAEKKRRRQAKPPKRTAVMGRDLPAPGEGKKPVKK